MAVYVDDVRHRYGRMIMCHLWADTDAEMHAMIDAIGMDRRWHQRPPKASWSHYDVCLEKKQMAIDRGAILTDKYGPVEHVARKKGDIRRLELIARKRALKGSTR
jgi:hypothetical protein